MRLRVLIGGEFTGTIRDAFIARGHDAISCDFKPSIAPGPHHIGNWREIEGDGFNLAIYHPTCTYMANSGAKHLYRNRAKAGGLDWERWTRMGQAAWEFWDHRERCPVPFAAWENPVMLGYAQMMVGKPSQTVQPWWFGSDPDGPDNVRKATCWWTNGGLPKLQPTGLLDGSTARDEVFRMAPTQDPEQRRMERSKFTPGHAAAIAEQWGGFVASQLATVA